VATPLEWDELSDSRLRPDRWNLRNVFRRLAAKGDPWAEIADGAKGLGEPRRRLERLR
jgi:bifunctional non-homologous end joining protein LigD